MPQPSSLLVSQRRRAPQRWYWHAPKPWRQVQARHASVRHLPRRLRHHRTPSTGRTRVGTRSLQTAAAALQARRPSTEATCVPVQRPRSLAAFHCVVAGRLTHAWTAVWRRGLLLRTRRCGCGACHHLGWACRRRLGHHPRACRWTWLRCSGSACARHWHARCAAQCSGPRAAFGPASASVPRSGIKER